MGGSNPPQHTDRFEFENIGIFSFTTTNTSEALHADVDEEMADQTEYIDYDDVDDILMEMADQTECIEKEMELEAVIRSEGSHGSSTTTDISEALHAGVDLADVEMADQTECIDSDAKQMISVSSFQYHRPFITATLKIQQNKIGIIRHKVRVTYFSLSKKISRLEKLFIKTLFTL